MQFPDYPFASHYHNVRGLALHYLDEGPQDAAPLIMLHGNPSWSFYYRRLVLALRDRHRCIVPDHIGMGLSDKPGAGEYPFTLDRRVDDLAALLDALHISENLTLILHDWGGMIGMAYATRFPARIKRLVVLNTAAFHLPEGKALPWQLRLSRIPLVNALLNQGLNAFARGAANYGVTRRAMSAEIARAYLAPYDCWRSRLAVKKFVEDIPLKKSDAAYNTVNEVARKLEQFSALPVLLCWGLRDFVFDQHFLQEWQRRFPNAELRRFEDAGHYILEDAFEEVLPLIDDFLSAHPLAEPGAC